MTHELSQRVLNKIKELASDLNSQLGYMLLYPVFVECRRVAKSSLAKMLMLETSNISLTSELVLLLKWR